jgi:hypothetical protein
MYCRIGGRSRVRTRLHLSASSPPTTNYHFGGKHVTKMNFKTLNMYFMIFSGVPWCDKTARVPSQQPSSCPVVRFTSVCMHFLSHELMPLHELCPRPQAQSECNSKCKSPPTQFRRRRRLQHRPRQFRRRRRLTFCLRYGGAGQGAGHVPRGCLLCGPLF